MIPVRSEVVVGFALLICGITPNWSWALPPPCHSVSLTAQLTAGHKFEQLIGGDLVFQISPEKPDADGSANAWSITLSPQITSRHDYIYPVNPPIRFNGLQRLGPGYGEDAKASLDYAHKMRFLLNQADYDRIEPFLTAALWPYSAPRPDTAGTEYLDALKGLRTGTAELTVLSYELQAGTDSIRSMKFRVVLTAPANFTFERHLRPKSCACRSVD
jgi:hypothetical protein